MITTTTQRRATKITAQKRGYVAVHVDYISESAQRIACVANKDMTITGEYGATASLKAGEAFYLVRSDSLSKRLGKAMFYIVRDVIGEKKCSCPANKPCKHETGLAVHIAEHGQPTIHLRAHQRQAEQSSGKLWAEFNARPKVAPRQCEDWSEPAIVGSVQHYIDQEWRGLDDVTLTDEEETESRRIREANKAAEEAAMRRFASQQTRQAEEQAKPAVSSIETKLPAFLKMAMAGNGRNGRFAGRAS